MIHSFFTTILLFFIINFYDVDVLKYNIINSNKTPGRFNREKGLSQVKSLHTYPIVMGQFISVHMTGKVIIVPIEKEALLKHSISY
jgi:hypothetical protein